MVALARNASGAGARVLRWVSPAHYGLLPGLLVPLIVGTLLAFVAIEFLETFVGAAHQRGLIDQRGATRLDGVVERFNDRRETLTSLAVALSDEPVLVQVLAGSPPDTAREALTALRATYGLVGLRLYDATAAELLTVANPGAEGPNRDLLQQAMVNGAASATVMSAHGPAVHAATLLQTEQGAAGIFVLSSELTLSTGNALDLAFFKDGSSVYTTSSDPGVQKLLSSKAYDLTELSALNHDLGSGFSVVGRQLGPGSFAIALVPTGDSAAAAEIVTQIRLLVTLVLGLALLAIAGMLANRFHRNIRRIVAGTAHIARGHYDERVEVGEIRELAHLGEAVNLMAGQLESRVGELERRASHDSLTNLPNRTLFMRRVDRALAGRPIDAQTVSVLFVDLDDFKVVNDTLGHSAGDELLIKVGDLLLSSVRPNDTVARLGGDEFSVLMPESSDESTTIEVATRILSRLERPVHLDGRDHMVHASVGIASAAPGSMTSGTLVRNADLAMYKAKRSGKNRYAVYSPDLLQNAWERLQVETDLRQCVTGGQIRLYYQPVMDLTTGKLAGAEALMRWQHPQRGFLTPDKFIDVAEETGLIVEMERWAHEEAGRQLHAWQEIAGSDLPLTMNMNLSPKQFQYENLAGRVMEAMRLTGASTNAITLEITEQTAIDMAESNVGALQALRDAGFNLAIDDFGVGHSALSYFKQFPVNAVKIDKSFVEGLGKDPTDTAIVQAMMSFAKTLNLKVTAEGIETQEQYEALRDLGCPRGQGYLFAKPLSSDDFEDMLVASLDGPSDLTGLRRTLEAAKQRLAA